jgi:hypothetical protein
LRLIVGISLLLLGIGTLSCRVEGLAARPAVTAESMEWVRTKDGWERPHAWHMTPAGRPRIHPLVVAAGQGLLSALALVAFHREAPPRDKRR